MQALNSIYAVLISILNLGPPLLECSDSTQSHEASDYVNLPVGCDLCFENGQSVSLLTLPCEPTTNRQPTNCTIRNPDGFSAQELNDGISFFLMGNILAIIDLDPHTVLGIWTCTCTNADGNVKAFSKISNCSCELYVNLVQAGS